MAIVRYRVAIVPSLLEVEDTTLTTQHEGAGGLGSTDVCLLFWVGWVTASVLLNVVCIIGSED